MQSDVRHVLLLPENAAWPYMENTCANSLPYSPSSFHLSLFLSSSVLVWTRFQQALDALGAHRAVSASLTNYMKETQVSRNGTENRAEQKGPTIRSQTEVTGLAQEEETGNTQEPLNPTESQGPVARCRTPPHPAEHKETLSCSRLLQSRAGGSTCSCILVLYRTKQSLGKAWS